MAEGRRAARADRRVPALGELLAGRPDRSCGPCSELYLDRGLAFGKEDDLPGGENERFLEFWNLVFMQFDQNPVNVLTPLPAKNIDTGLGLNRFAAILQGKESVFETDQFWPLIELGQELSGRTYGQDEETTRALRILADHSRAMTFLVADGVVPSNEDRGYILRRVMRRAIQHGRRIGIEPGFLPKFATLVEQLMGNAYPEIVEQREAILKWLVAEEEGFGRTLEQGTRLLDELIAEAKRDGKEGLGAADVFQLHDTYGFPIDITREIAAEHDLGVDEAGFEALMEQQRAQSRAGAGGSKGGGRDELRSRAQSLAFDAAFTSEFTGYVTTDQETTVGALEAERDGHVLVKLVESPFYAAGGGQVSDAGWVTCADGDCRARVVDVLRVAGGADQVLVLEPEVGTLKPGEHVTAVVDRAARHATEANHTATHLLHAALRRTLGNHVRQAGSAVQPDKLRFDFTHSQALTPEELRAVEDEVNERILANLPVRWLTTTLDEAKKLGAMALFGEKYGDVVRMVEIGDGSFSRELCGGTHVRSTAEIGLFKVTAETSSAANVRRIEAITGPAAVTQLREHDVALRDGGDRAARDAGAGPGRGREAARPHQGAGEGRQAGWRRGRRARPRRARRERDRARRRRARADGRRRVGRPEGAAGRRRPRQGQARRRRDRARRGRRRQSPPRRDGRPGARRAGREGRRDRQGRGRGDGRRRWRSRHDGACGRPRP